MSKAEKQTTTELTRREATHAGMVLAAVAALAGGSGMANAATVDPIFPLIEAHKAAYVANARAGKIESELAHKDPHYEPASAASAATWDKLTAAAMALATTRATTLSGVVALLAHVEDFNNGGVIVPELRGLPPLEDWHSAVYSWPNLKADDSDGCEVNGFPFLILQNVQAALQSLA